MQPLISVIIPVYNVEKYLEKCVASVLSQTYKNLEIILVDDGSTDNSGQMCDEFKKKDKRIKVIHKENGGLSDARNVALDVCKGDYITFVDSDDWVEKKYVEVLYDALVKYDVDIAIGDNIIRYEKGRVFNISNNSERKISSEKFFEYMLWGERDLDNGAWTKLYKRKLFEGIRYPVGRLYEDTATTYKIVEKCDFVVICSVPIYNYLKRESSITYSSFSRKKMDLIDSTKEMTSFVRKKYPLLQDACDRKLLWAYLSTLSQLAMSNTKWKEYEKELMHYIRKNGSRVLKFKKTPMRDRIGIVISKLGFPVYKLVWRFYIKISGRV